MVEEYRHGNGKRDAFCASLESCCRFTRCTWNYRRRATQTTERCATWESRSAAPRFSPPGTDLPVTTNPPTTLSPPGTATSNKDLSWRHSLLEQQTCTATGLQANRSSIPATVELSCKNANFHQLYYCCSNGKLHHSKVYYCSTATVNSPCAGWVESFMMEAALPLHLVM